MSVDTPSLAVFAANTSRELPRALMGGTTSMRVAGVKYLPQEMAESNLAYQIRLRRSFLFNAYGKTVRDMAGKVFAKPIIVGDDMPPNLVGYCENIDLTGRNLDVFGHAVFSDGLAEGISYILVDMGAAPEGAVTIADTRGRRPYAVHIKAAQVLGWRSEDRDGVETLTQFRFMESLCESDGEYGERLVEQVRVFNRVADAVEWMAYRRIAGKTDWALHDQGKVTIGEIAICPVYLSRTGFMTGTPPLSDLAEVNLAHWQSQSDQRNILHVARVPILFGAGIPEGQALEIGAARMVRGPDKDAKLAYVEHSGAAIGAGRDDLKDLEFQMQTLGLELLIPKPGGQTATGAAIDQARMNAPLGMMAMALKDALEQMFGFMALYAGLGRDTGGGSLTVNTDFAAGARAGDTTDLIAAVSAKVISRETAIREMMRRGVLTDGLDVEAEVLAAINDGYDADEE